MKLRQRVQDMLIIGAAYKRARRREITEPTNYGNENILILATGPSSTQFWQSENYRDRWKKESYDICLMNDAFFKYKDIVFQVKPKFYCLMDSYYFDKNAVTADEIKRLQNYKEKRKILNEVDWKMVLIIPGGVSVDWLNNPTIEVVRLNTIAMNREDFPRRFWFYQKNWMCPGRNNVVHSALYFAITFGYRQIALVGGEFNYWKNVYLNRERHVIQEIEHCYEASMLERRYDLEEDYHGHREGTMYAYLLRLADTFSIYHFIREYADMMGARITNYSEGTMIEAFEIAEELEMVNG